MFETRYAQILIIQYNLSLTFKIIFVFILVWSNFVFNHLTHRKLHIYVYFVCAYYFLRRLIVIFNVFKIIQLNWNRYLFWWKRLCNLCCSRSYYLFWICVTIIILFNWHRYLRLTLIRKLIVNLMLDNLLLNNCVFHFLQLFFSWSRINFLGFLFLWFYDYFCIFLF